jgi:hypothetical protein
MELVMYWSEGVRFNRSIYNYFTHSEMLYLISFELSMAVELWHSCFAS